MNCMKAGRNLHAFAKIAVKIICRFAQAKPTIGDTSAEEPDTNTVPGSNNASAEAPIGASAG